jgi:hypothetical protein
LQENLRAEHFLGCHIHRRSQDGLHLHEQAAEIHQGSFRIQIHQKIDVAGSGAIAARYRPKNPEIARALTVGESKDLIPF